MGDGHSAAAGCENGNKNIGVLRGQRRLRMLATPVASWSAAPCPRWPSATLPAAAGRAGMSGGAFSFWFPCSQKLCYPLGRPSAMSRTLRLKCRAPPNLLDPPWSARILSHSHTKTVLSGWPAATAPQYVIDWAAAAAPCSPGKRVGPAAAECLRHELQCLQDGVSERWQGKQPSPIVKVSQERGSCCSKAR